MYRRTQFHPDYAASPELGDVPAFRLTWSNDDHREFARKVLDPRLRPLGGAAQSADPRRFASCLTAWDADGKLIDGVEEDPAWDLDGPLTFDSLMGAAALVPRRPPVTVSWDGNKLTFAADDPAERRLLVVTPLTSGQATLADRIDLTRTSDHDVALTSGATAVDVDDTVARLAVVLDEAGVWQRTHPAEAQFEYWKGGWDNPLPVLELVAELTACETAAWTPRQGDQIVAVGRDWPGTLPELLDVVTALGLTCTDAPVAAPVRVA